MSNYKVSFKKINITALNNSLAILQRWLPDGQLIGNEYKALNPTRNDTKNGSFSINILNGKWADFATGDKGGDMISLTAYLFKIKQYEAAERLSYMLGIEA